ncbi:MAG: PLD nuclease N-terminal domain-containing protein [bacterium]|jgi:hypothetical protein|nr:PLD nuclease N-terminal domain-containing protein [bacterium]
MKKYVVSVVLVILVLAPAAFCQAPPEEIQGYPQADIEQDFEEPGQKLEIERDLEEHGPHIKIEREVKMHRPKGKFKHEFDQRDRQMDLEERQLTLDYKRSHLKKKAHYKKRWRKKMCFFLTLCLIVHILLTVWVYQDIRTRSSGSGLWIVITLLTGFFGALLYLLARLGDKKEE